MISGLERLLTAGAESWCLHPMHMALLPLRRVAIARLERTLITGAECWSSHAVALLLLLQAHPAPGILTPAGIAFPWWLMAYPWAVLEGQLAQAFFSGKGVLFPGS